MTPQQVGTIGWLDITVPDAEALRAFYERVIGWKSQPVDMDGYNDHCMLPPGSEVPTAGICHARGVNADLPPQWLVYLFVADLEASVRSCRELGGSILREPSDACGARIAIIRDPAGAVCALYEQPPSKPA